jgi:hypothetical protein
MKLLAHFSIPLRTGQLPHPMMSRQDRQLQDPTHWDQDPGDVLQDLVPLGVGLDTNQGLQAPG